MQCPSRGCAALVILSSLLAAKMAAGCRQGGDYQPAARRPPTTQAQRPAPGTTREVVARENVEVPPELAQIPPVAMLPAGEQTLFYNVMGPLGLRITRGDGSVLTEMDVRSGEVLIVDRRTGVRLSRQGGSETLVPGPLDERAIYSLYALPIGGVRSESERTLIRPETSAEYQARVRALEEERRRRQAEEAATRPADTGPG